MRFQCQNCQKIVSIDDSECGRPVGCGHCGSITVVPESRFAKGAMINDFIIRDTLGNGGMGTVYLAHQLSLDRPVALKILMEQFSRNSEFIVDFVREARAAARLNHPNIVQSYAVGEDEGIYFFAMEYVEGKTLRDMLNESPKLAWEQALGIIQQIAEALDFAWKNQQLVHRDIKPDNIMMTPRGVAKLADLGLARAASETMDDDDEVMGTPQYICPEQLLGQPMDVRGDIYSLGATLFHAVTGNFPFEGNSAAEIARKHLNEPVPALQTFAADIPKTVDHIVRKMMAKKLEDRYEDAEELVVDIGFVLRGQKPTGYKGGSGKSAKKKTHHGKTGVRMPAPKGPSKSKHATRGSRTRTRIGTSKGSGKHRAMPPPAQVANGTENHDTQVKSGGDQSMTVKKTGRIKVSGTKRKSTRGTATGNKPVATGTTGGYRPPGSAPQSGGGGGKIAIVFLLLVIAVLGGVITWFIVQVNKYNFKTTNEAKALYLAEKVSSNQERQDYLDLELYLDGEVKPEDGEKAFKLTSDFVSNYPKSLFCNYSPGGMEKKEEFYSVQYIVPLGFTFFSRNISKKADALAGKVRRRRDTIIAETYTRAMRTTDENDEEQRKKVSAAEYDFEQAKAALLSDLNSLAAKYADQYSSQKTTFTQSVDAIRESWDQERAKYREEILALTQKLNFSDAVLVLKKRQVDKSIFSSPIAPKIRQFQRLAVDEKATREIQDLHTKHMVPLIVLGKVEELKQGFVVSSLRTQFKAMFSEKGGDNTSQEINDLLAAEQKISRDRDAWFEAQTKAMELAMEYNALVADIRTRLPGNYGKAASKLPGRRIEYDLVPRNRKVRPYKFKTVKYKNGDKVVISSIQRYDMIVSIYRYNRDGKLLPVTTGATEKVPLLEVIRLGLFNRLAKAGWIDKQGDEGEFRERRALHEYYVRTKAEQTKTRLEAEAGSQSCKFAIDELNEM